MMWTSVAPAQIVPLPNTLPNQTVSNNANHLRHRLSNSPNNKYSEDHPNMQPPAGNHGNSRSWKYIKEVFAFFYLFMENSSIHGFNHLTTKKRTIYDYILWFIILCVGVWGCVNFSLRALHHFQENPTVISMERDYMLWNTTLPSVTMCPIKRYDNNDVENYVSKLHNVPSSENVQTFIKNLTLASYDTFKHIPDVTQNPVTPNNYLKTVNSISLKLNMKLNPSDGDKPKDIVQYYNERGLCFAYNTYMPMYNTYEYWRANNWSIIPVPEFTYGNYLDGDIFMTFENMSSASMVYIHSPFDIPDGAKRGYSQRRNATTRLTFIALYIYSADEVKSLTLKQRKCRFLDESNLEISPAYSYNLCRMQCRMKYANTLCHCVPFFYRQLGEYSICDVKGMQCIHDNKDIIVNLIEKNSKRRKKINCNCLPPCDDINYMLDLEEITLWVDKYIQNDFAYGMTKYPTMRLKREILFGFTDLLVSVGGTAGLFLGCSVLSFIEIFYFFTLRLFLYIYYKKKGC